jgi:hypothetical protein
MAYHLSRTLADGRAQTVHYSRSVLQEDYNSACVVFVQVTTSHRRASPRTFLTARSRRSA